MAMGERGAYWAGHLAGAGKEGLTLAAYARREGLAVHSLYKWRHRLRQRGTVAVDAPRFITVSVARSQIVEGSGTEDVLTVAPDGTLHCRAWPTPQWLTAVVGTLARSG